MRKPHAKKQPTPSLEMIAAVKRAIVEQEAFDEDDPGRGWPSPLWTFIRHCKAHAQLGSMEPREAFNMIEETLSWLRQDAAHILETNGDSYPRTKRHFPNGQPESANDDWFFWLTVSREDAQTEILDAWAKVRYLPGRDPLDNALEQARRCALLLPSEELARYSDGFPKFVSIAGHLQVAMGNRPIMLPVEKLAKLLGVEKMTISRYRRAAIELGYIAPVKAHQFNGKGGKATEFRFDVALFPCLLDTAENGTAESFQSV